MVEWFTSVTEKKFGNENTAWMDIECIMDQCLLK